MTEIALSQKPPSVNECYGNNKTGKGRGRYITPVYAAWIRLAKQEIMIQRINRFFPGKFTCEIILDVSQWAGQADIDNRVKPLMDTLKKAGVIKDDRKCQDNRIRLAWIDGADMIVRLDDHDGTYETVTPQFKFGEAA